MSCSQKIGLVGGGGGVLEFKIKKIQVCDGDRDGGELTE